MKLLFIFAMAQSLFWPPGDMKKCKILLSIGNHILFDIKFLFNRITKNPERNFSFSLSLQSKLYCT